MYISVDQMLPVCHSVTCVVFKVKNQVYYLCFYMNENLIFLSWHTEEVKITDAWYKFLCFNIFTKKKKERKKEFQVN